MIINDIPKIFLYLELCADVSFVPIRQNQVEVVEDVGEDQEYLNNNIQ